MPAKVAVAVRPVRGFGEVSVGTPNAARWTICILAGGQSLRMGRDKSRIRIAGQTLVQRVRSVAVSTGLPVRAIRKDAVPACGPLGGILTGLRRGRPDWCLFVTCDMPLITCRLLDDIKNRAEALGRPVFVRTENGFGFPMALPVTAIPAVEELIAGNRLSVQYLAARLKASAFAIPKSRRNELTNANTPAELAGLRRRLAGGAGGTSG